MKMTRIQRSPLTIAEYASEAHKTDRFASDPEKDKLAFGFFGEIGSLLSALKKIRRDELLETEAEVAGEEIGDALWYLMALADAYDLKPDHIGYICLSFLRSKLEEKPCEEGIRNINFRHIDALTAIHTHKLERNSLLQELAEMTGRVIKRGEHPQLDLHASSMSELLGRLLGMLGLVTSLFMLKLEEVAVDNLKKIQNRWPGNNRVYINLFDSKSPRHEQLPRIIPMEFIERNIGGKYFVVQQLNGVNVGDRLTDNISEPDDYRFHDVFHLSYVAHLGWSPVIRALLKVKRKSDPKIDENEDGARAIIIEEGIATWIFNHAKNREFYEHIQLGKLDYGLLKQIQNMVVGYEVEECPLWQWEAAILDGFKVFRELCKTQNRGGKVTVDMVNHTLTFTPSKKRQ